MLLERKIHLGPAGWHYADWKGRVYPKRAPRGFEELRFLVRFVNLVEINTSFYAPLRANVAEAWLPLVSWRADFRFVLKLWQRFTHGNEELGVSDAELVKEGMRPLREAGRLLAVLAQFPLSFAATERAREKLCKIRDLLKIEALATEFRHVSWMNADVLSFLQREGFCFVNIDQPRSSEGIPPTEISTQALSYVRLHGRNARAWFDPQAGRDARYDYRYSKEEIREWSERILKLSQRSEQTIVVGNNHYEGKAVAAVLELDAAIHGRRVLVPEGLRAGDASLEEIAKKGDGELF